MDDCRDLFYVAATIFRTSKIYGSKGRIEDMEFDIRKVGLG